MSKVEKLSWMNLQDMMAFLMLKAAHLNTSRPDIVINKLSDEVPGFIKQWRQVAWSEYVRRITFYEIHPVL